MGNNNSNFSNYFSNLKISILISTDKYPLKYINSKNFSDENFVYFKPYKKFKSMNFNLEILKKYKHSLDTLQLYQIDITMWVYLFFTIKLNIRNLFSI